MGKNSKSVQNKKNARERKKDKASKLVNFNKGQQKHNIKTDLNSLLQSIYHDKVDLNTTCNHEVCCCKVACPSMNQSEYLNIITDLWPKLSKDNKINLIVKSIEYFFKTDYEKFAKEIFIKPCMLLDNKDLCGIYDRRPLSCFLPETWIYTDNGPKMIKDILAGDMVYGIDGNLHSVVATTSKIHNGKIYGINYQGNDIVSWSTYDHLWHVAFHKDRRVKIGTVWEKADKLIPKKTHQFGHYLTMPMSYESKENLNEINALDYISGEVIDNRVYPYSGGKLFEDKEIRSIPLSININSEFLFMIGIYLAEGSSSSQSATFTMNKKELAILGRIENYLKTIGIPTHYNKIDENKNAVVLRVDSCLFARLISELCGKLSQNKKINELFFNKLSSTQQLEIFYGWNEGDGRKGLDNEFSVVTISEKLALQMNLILLKNGIFPRVYKNKRDNRGFFNYDVHVFPSALGIECKKGQGTKIIKDEKFYYVPIKEIIEKEYNGPVIDIQVEKVESFVTTTGIAHNCRVYGLWPKESYEQRVDKFEKAYSKYGIKREDLPLNTQCPHVKRVDETIPLTQELIEGLYKSIDRVDETIGDFSSLQIEQKENYRTFHDWLLFSIYGIEWLSKLSVLSMAADKSTLEDQIAAFKVAIENSFKDKEVPNITFRRK